MRSSNEQIESVQRRVTSGEYFVDSEQVATAMLERIGATISHHEVVSETEGGRALMRALTGLRAA
jgi:anti-sigma-28 factor FlgM